MDGCDTLVFILELFSWYKLMFATLKPAELTELCSPDDLTISITLLMFYVLMSIVLF